MKDFKLDNTFGNRFKFIFKLENDEHQLQLQRLVNELAYVRTGTVLGLLNVLNRVKERKDVKPWEWVQFDSGNKITWPEHSEPVLVVLKCLDKQWYAVLERSGGVDECRWFTRTNFTCDWLSSDIVVHCWCKIGNQD